MVFDSPGEWTTKQWIAIGLLTVFAIAMLPPGLWLVNEPTLVAGYPVLYLWSVGWALFAILVLLWASRENLFGITDDKTPPELAARSDVAVTGSEASVTGGDDSATETPPEDSTAGGDR